VLWIMAPRFSKATEKVVSDDYRQTIRSMSSVPVMGVGPNRRGEAR
jgi:hypothetical protein